MSTRTAPTEDDQLRGLVTSADPFAGDPTLAPEHLWARIADGIAADASPPATSGAGEPLLIYANSGKGRRPWFGRRHWQAGLITAAAVATFALAASTVVPGLAGLSADDKSAGNVSESDRGEAPAASPEQGGGTDPALPPSRDGSQFGDTDGSATDSAGDAAVAKDPTLVRSGSMIVGTDDIQGGRDRFAAAVLQMGGMLTSETVTTQGDEGASNGVARDIAATYPYPYPTGPGVWLSAKVPAESYDEALEVARSTGEVVQLQQSSYDVGSQITDVNARIAVLTESLKRLQGLMGEANGVSEIVALESAISNRQAELGSLVAQQRDLADQTEMSQISLTLMSPQDAHQTVDPEPQLTWWESFVDGLGQFWSWLGQALLIVSPLLIAGAIVLWVRRRRPRGPTNTGQRPAPETA